MKKSIKFLSVVMASFLLFSNHTAFAGLGASKISSDTRINPRCSDSITPAERAELDTIRKEVTNIPEQHKSEWRKTLSRPVKNSTHVRALSNGKPAPMVPTIEREESRNKVLKLTGKSNDEDFAVLSACSNLKDRIINLLISTTSPTQQLGIFIELCEIFGYSNSIESNPAYLKKMMAGEVTRVEAAINPLNGILEVTCVFNDSSKFTILI